MDNYEYINYNNKIFDFKRHLMQRYIYIKYIYILIHNNNLFYIYSSIIRSSLLNISINIYANLYPPIAN